ncbi:hypothetical protein VA7868_02976 [Vibrio aerogenes CECT 7868]|uniref:Elp3/MiaA/NifB-like radical SAM core domain-containing protein n=1 Tax=Vibrio aerogenes CECT 7868 TaxID=1216006 RepID=A0A1M5ZNE8_9VIBR|nr:hypothetical protein [Vibrio aerogenes]SHI25750.1 hypothetical protein VA7868_02976 [Vibrio aerogenes CECT 7868]
MTQLICGYPCHTGNDIRYSFSLGKQIVQQTLVIPGGGCSYYRSKKGKACTFCAFPGLTRAVTKGNGHEDFFGSWRLETKIYQMMFDTLTRGTKQVDRLAIFNGGSFFPKAEIPDDFQQYVCRQVARRSDIRQLLVECYPRFITRHKLLQTLDWLAGKQLVVAVGLESRDDRVRNQLLNKGIDIRIFEQKVKMMQAMGVKVAVYVFLKAPQLTEKEAFDDVMNTLSYLHQLGVDEMMLSCAFVQENTPLESMYKAGTFRPPWLWTILHIIREAQEKSWPLIVGGFNDTPPPVAGPSNCTHCDQILLDMIESSRRNGVLPEVMPPMCDCFNEWDKLMGESQPGGQKTECLSV